MKIITSKTKNRMAENLALIYCQILRSVEDLNECEDAIRAIADVAFDIGGSSYCQKVQELVDRKWKDDFYSGGSKSGLGTNEQRKGET